MQGTITIELKSTTIPRKFLFFILLIIACAQTSCVKHPQLLYFRNQTEFTPLVNHEINNLSRIKIQPDDALLITVKSLDEEASEPFNLFPSNSVIAMGNSINPTLTGYLVDLDGNIDFPVLGELGLGGKSTDEAKSFLVEKLEPYLKNPVVSIRFMNFRFTVLGEVGSPRTVSVQGERITILEALGQAGDLTAYSNREKILVVREQAGKREFGYINIHSPEVFQSPYFYLQQNDIVYVEPIQQATATVRDPISEILPILSGAISVAAILVAFLR